MESTHNDMAVTANSLFASQEKSIISLFSSDSSTVSPIYCLTGQEGCQDLIISNVLVVATGKLSLQLIKYTKTLWFLSENSTMFPMYQLSPYTHPVHFPGWKICCFLLWQFSNSNNSTRSRRQIFKQQEIRRTLFIATKQCFVGMNDDEMEWMMMRFCPFYSFCINILVIQ